jgi:hypothetical protein
MTREVSMLRWITEARRWIVLILVLAGIIFVLTHYCIRSEPRPEPDRELIEEAVEKGWGVDLEPELVPEKEIKKKVDIQSGTIESATTAEFEQPVKSVDVVVSEAGNVLITGRDEAGENLAPIRVNTLRAKPRPEPWLKRDFGIALGACWDFDRTVEPCIRIQTWRWFGAVAAPDPVLTLRYAGVSANLPLRIWLLKNTSMGAAVKWNYGAFSPVPCVSLVLTVQL